MCQEYKSFQASFCANTLLGTPGGTRIKFSKMSGKQTNPAVISVTMEKLTEDQRNKVEQAMKEYQRLCLECFGETQQGTLQKTDLPVPTLVDKFSPTEKA